MSKHSTHTSSPARLEAFSDGVIAVIITIMVLELKVPAQNGLAGLRAILPTLVIYLLSFTLTGIYWINHHHLVHRIAKPITAFFMPISDFCSASLSSRSSQPICSKKSWTRSRSRSTLSR